VSLAHQALDATLGHAQAARAPYFHNGSAATLDDVVDFYDRRFALGLSPQDHADLVAFLRSL
jgi:cytochrome c peroxidase